MRRHFRFEDLEIWQLAKSLAGRFHRLADSLRRSLFEDASMLLVFGSLGLFSSSEIETPLTDCDVLSRKITNFSRTLKS
jgi:hypothetical protein